MKRLPQKLLVDTNVAVVANGKSKQASDSLVEKCIDKLLKLTVDGGLVLDDEGLIFEEYRQNLSLSGQPGTGDAFLKWVHDFQWNSNFCERRTITCLQNDKRGFAEFPNSIALENFDPSDRKFVAVANASKPKPSILEAVDFKWWGWKEALAAEDIKVIFLDPSAAQEGFKKHSKNG